MLKACLIIDICPSHMGKATRYPHLEVKKLKYKAPLMLKADTFLELDDDGFPY